MPKSCGMCEPGEYKMTYRHSTGTSVELWQRVVKRLNINIKATVEYDENEMKEREREVRNSPYLEKSDGSFMGRSEF